MRKSQIKKFVILFCFILSIVIISGCTSSSHNDDYSKSVNYYKTATPTPTPSVQSFWDGKHKTWTDWGLNVTLEEWGIYDSYEWSGSSGYIHTEKPKSGYQFVVFWVKFENVGYDSERVSKYHFSLEDSEGYKYDPNFSYLDDDLPSTELYPGQKVKGSVLFEIPIKVTQSPGMKLYYYFGTSYDPELVSWGLNYID